ncbi:transposase [uncultured Fluviicola sp.]|uniref:transposase n=1 Tax=uncultured Fluviicola sp. TaxID=463303 RepID=UPI0025F7A383|nr:transposase [uncultured Fluviicola sp.]
MNQYAYFHLTTNLHDSRTSQRMIDYRVRQRRFFGTLPYPEVYYMNMEEETLIAKEVFCLSNEMDFVVVALNLCRDHMHLLVYCEIDEIPKIMHRIKGRTARACNAHRAAKGINPLDATNGKYEPRILKDKSIPFWTQKYHCKVIRNSDQLLNTISYILNNRKKHGLPINPALQNVIDKNQLAASPNALINLIDFAVLLL